VQKLCTNAIAFVTHDQRQLLETGQIGGHEFTVRAGSNNRIPMALQARDGRLLRPVSMNLDPTLGPQGHLSHKQERLDAFDHVNLLKSKRITSAKDCSPVVRVVGRINYDGDIVRACVNYVHDARAPLLEHQWFEYGNQAFRTPTNRPGAVVPVGGRNIDDSVAFPAHSADVARYAHKGGLLDCSAALCWLNHHSPERPMPD
jgi:hypothetical protein